MCKGKEVYNSKFSNVLKTFNAYHFSIDQELKAQIGERFRRMLHDKVKKYMDVKFTLRYINILPDLLLGYYSHIHVVLKVMHPGYKEN